jgi:hypothetical protein
MHPFFRNSSLLLAFAFPVLLVHPRPARADSVFVDDCFNLDVGASCGFGQGTCRKKCVDESSPPPDAHDEAQSPERRCGFECRDSQGQSVPISRDPDDPSCTPRCIIAVDDCYYQDAGASCGFGQGTCWEICVDAGPPLPATQSDAGGRPQQCIAECVDANGQPVDVERYPDESSCAARCALGRRARTAAGIVATSLLGIAFVLYRRRRGL